ncbi:hypothetical protein NPX13_g711 [Xylaria arbuscula]|uniref:Uncharacterized protein n=1 Tax=Xylaria arbuscula TaxID=114810 RepID=A0A9W8NN01_9PEZI|nr:hypothetical protein NPX13_g711 [Xylaria arbuscula]
MGDTGKILPASETVADCRVGPRQPWKEWMAAVEAQAPSEKRPWVGWQPAHDLSGEKPWLEWVKYYVYPEEIFGDNSSPDTEITPELWQKASQREHFDGGDPPVASTAAEGG